MSKGNEFKGTVEVNSKILPQQEYLALWDI